MLQFKQWTLFEWLILRKKFYFAIFKMCIEKWIYGTLRQKGYNEEEPAGTKIITPTILEFPKNMMFVLVN
jgi:hypothetical protein